MRRVTLGGEECFRKRNRGVRSTDRESTARELTGKTPAKMNSETGGAQVSEEPHGETTRDNYAGTETGDAQVEGLSRAEVRKAVSTDMTGGKLSLGGKSEDGRGGKGRR